MGRGQGGRSPGCCATPCTQSSQGTLPQHDKIPGGACSALHTRKKVALTSCSATSTEVKTTDFLRRALQRLPLAVERATRRA